MRMRAAVLGAIVSLSVGGSVGCKGGEGGGEIGDPCGSNSDCKPGLECDPITHTCQQSGGGIDARVIDAPPGTPDGPPAIPPNTTLVTRPPSSTQSTTATFTFSSDQAPVTFECRLDGGSFAACPTPQTYNGLAEGPHTFEVRAKNSDNLVDGTPESYTWEVDNAPPNTTITSGPSGDIATSEVAYQFTCDDAPCTFECRIDAAAFAACDTGDSFGGLTLGSHTFEVRATDSAGNVDPTPDSRTVNVTATTPETVITSAPPEFTNQTTATFEFKCVEAGADVPCTFVCSLDGAAAAACTSGQTYVGLAVGPHAFTVLGTTDPGGKVDPSAARHDWTIDLTAPVVTILTGPQNGETTGRQVSFTYSADSPVVLFECAIDGAFAECSPDGVTFLSLDGGSRTFSVRATDAAGNVSDPATRTFTVDAEGPIVTVTSPGPISGPSGTLTFTATDVSPPITTRCSVNGSDFVDCASGFMYSNLPGGPIALVIEATDKWGNQSLTTFNVTIDAVGPNVFITEPQTGEATAADGMVAFVADADAVRFTCTVDDQDIPCSGTSFDFANLLTGIHTATVTAYDEFDNPSPVPASVTWPVDADPPIVEISSPANGQVVCSVVTAVFDTVPDDDIVTYQCASDLDQLAPCFEPSVTFEYKSGTHTIRVLATDAVGNVSENEATVTFTIDNAPPVGTITAPRDLSQQEELEVTCSAGPITWQATDPVLSTNGTVTYVVDSCLIEEGFIVGARKLGGGGQGTSPPEFPIACDNADGDGLSLAYSRLLTSDTFYTVGLTIQDACGNETQLARDFNTDTVAPTVAIVTPSDGSTTCNSGPVTYTGFDLFESTNPSAPPAFEDATLFNAAGAPFPCTPGGTPCTSNDGGVPGAVAYSGLAETGNSFVARVRMHDACENIGTASASFNVDTTAPVIDDKSFRSSTAGQGTSTVTFQVADASDVSVQGGSVLAPFFVVPPSTFNCTGCASTRTSPDVPWTVTCTCSSLAADANYLAFQASAQCSQTSAWTVGTGNATYGPNDGHAVLLAHDYTDAATPSFLLANGVALAPFVHRSIASITRPVRVLGYSGVLPGSGLCSNPGDDLGFGRENAWKAIATFATAYGPPFVCDEFPTPASQLGTLLPGYDVFVIFDQENNMTDQIAATWRPTLLNFLNNGGIVLLLNGATASQTPSPTNTDLVFTYTDPTFAPIIAARSKTVFSPNDFLNDYAAANPFPTPNYWLARNPAGGTFLSYAPFIGGTSPYDGFYLDQNIPNVINDGVGLIYEQRFDSCSDGCPAKWPVVMEKVFPSYGITVTPTLVSQGRADTTGTGTFQVNTAGVSRSGFSCYMHTFPRFGNTNTDDQPVACTITSSPADTQVGTYSYNVTTTRDETQGWVTVITLRDRNNEPANTGMAGSFIDGGAFASAFALPIGNTTNSRQTGWQALEFLPTSGTEFVSNVTCRLAFSATGMPPFDLDTCMAPSCMIVSTRSGAACGMVPEPGQPAGTFQGTGTIDWTSNIGANGFYRAGVVVTDVFGNSDGTVTNSWVVNDIII